ncbi:MAG: ribokinase [Chloroflexi bacterium]|nr:ribokinase [Chloroflexota bacterium]MDL1944142.1 ribokinase [Chloroflexi bacterium CFX2]
MSSAPKHSILVVGSLNADLVVRAPRFPQPGETLGGEDLQIIPGGKGANQAVAAARQGVKTAMLGRVGSDSFAAFLLDNLKSNNVDTSRVMPTDSATGAAIIVVDANGQNSIVLSPGANGRVSPADVETASFPDFKLLLLQLEIPAPAVLRAAQKAREHGLTVVLNPAPANPLPDELLANVDILIPNESELSLLTGMPVDDVSSAERAAKEILKRGVKTVIVTLGGRGALLVMGAGAAHINTYKVDVVDTTAAGDAFIGGFAAKLLESGGSPADMQEQTLALQNAVRYGCACGALAATKFGAQPSLPAKDEVEKFLNQSLISNFQTCPQNTSF